MVFKFIDKFIDYYYMYKYNIISRSPIKSNVDRKINFYGFIINKFVYSLKLKQGTKFQFTA